MSAAAVDLSVPADLVAMADTVRRALASRGKRDAAEVLAELGVAELRGSLFPAAIVAEAAGREGVLAFPGAHPLLDAAACAGMAARALEDAAAYACERVVFGKPIALYQGVSHALAQWYGQVDGTRLLVWRAIALGDAQRAAQALWWCHRACLPAIKASMRVFGGYGMTEDSILPHLYRSVRALALSRGDPDRLLLGEMTLPEGWSADCPVNFEHGGEAAWRARTEAFLAAEFTAADKAAFADALDNHIPALHRKLAAAGLLFPDWAPENGGEGASDFDTSAVRRTLSRRGWPTSVIAVADTIGKLLVKFGTPEARAEILPRIASGESVCCLGLSETVGGSDVFAAKTRSEKTPEGWVVNGQKVFTTSGHIADYALLLTRSEAGLTLFVAPLDRPGFEAHPIQTFAGERTNITFYSDFAVADRYLLGEAGQGAKVLAATLTLEHTMGDYNLAALLAVEDEMAEHFPQGTGDVLKDLSVARLKAHRALLECLSIRTIWAGNAGLSQRWHGPVTKLFGTESWVSCCAEIVDRFAPESLSGLNPALKVAESEARRGIPSTVYGGASEIQRSIIAETALGLPRTR